MKFILTLLLFCCSVQAEKPNIIILYVDDMGWAGVGSYGCKFIDTPNIDQMTLDGVKFTNAYSPAPNCSPSRASLLTGLYPPKHGITQYLFGNKNSKKFSKTPVVQADLPEGLETKFTTIAEVFKENGYNTASMGKWHLGGSDYFPEKHGFDINIGGTAAGHHSSVYPPYLEGQKSMVGNEGEHINDCLQRYALDYIDQKSGKPFFLYIPFYSVHSPWGGNKELTAKYNSRVTGKSKINYSAMTEGVDRFVGALRKKLKDKGIDENTILVFSSDNGGAFDETCEQLRAKKGFVYEGGIRVPMIISGKGVKSGLVEHTPVNHIDLMPTLLKMAGINSPETDGVDISPLLDGTGKIANRDLFWHYPHYANSGGKPGSVIRRGDFKLIYWYETDSTVLYNLKEDLAETTDLSSKYPEKSQEMNQALQKWLKDSRAVIPEKRK